MRTYRIAVVGGDGIGPEVIGCALDVLAEALPGVSGFELDFVEAPGRRGDVSRSRGRRSGATLAACRAADAILLGACGCRGSAIPTAPRSSPR
jgi:3-isopropylmalate dehydrogenase